LTATIARLVLAGCGSSAASTSSTTPASSLFVSQTAGEIALQAEHAMTAAGSVASNIDAVVKIPDLGKVSFRENNDSGPDSGSQTLAMSADAPGTTPLVTVSVLDVDGDLYNNGNAAFWTTNAGMASVQSVALAGKWVQIPAGTSFYTQAADDLTMSTLVRDSFDATAFHKGAVKTVDGVPAIAITYTNGGVDKGSAVANIAVDGKHLPVSVTIQSLALHLGPRGKPVVVTPPQGWVSMESVLATVPSGSTTD
jgi:hypothetical protein